MNNTQGTSEKTGVAMTNKTAITFLEDVTEADLGSFYTIRGAGGDLSDWVEGMTGLLEEAEIGTPREWFETTGAIVNEYADGEGADKFPEDLTFLMFSLEGLDIGKLAMVRLNQGDMWFDDMIANIKNIYDAYTDIESLDDAYELDGDTNDSGNDEG